MRVPSYYSSRQGHVFRLRRVHEPGPAQGSFRYVLRAFRVDLESNRESRRQPAAEVAVEVDSGETLEQVRRRQVVTTPEERFERLWQQLRLELDAL